VAPPTYHQFQQRLGEAFDRLANQLSWRTASKSQRSLLQLIKTDQLVDLYGHGTGNFQHGHGSTSC
jgi:hypothetical protein